MAKWDNEKIGKAIVEPVKRSLVPEEEWCQKKNDFPDERLLATHDKFWFWYCLKHFSFGDEFSFPIILIPDPILTLIGYASLKPQLEPQ